MLLLFFNDLNEDHAGCVHRIVRFMSVALAMDEDTIARVVHTTTHAEMVLYHTNSTHRGLLLCDTCEKMGRNFDIGGR